MKTNRPSVGPGYLTTSLFPKAITQSGKPAGRHKKKAPRSGKAGGASLVKNVAQVRPARA